MYVQKFKYIELSRSNIDGQRKYSSPDGQYLPSVTTILEATKSEEKKKSLQQWKSRIGVENAQRITTEAANRGTKMHLYLEHYVKENRLKDKPGNILHHASWYMADEVIKKGLINCNEFWGIEVPLYFPKIYAGTTDCVGLHNNVESIIDFKQTNKPKKREWIEDYFLQLCAYANAHNELHGTNIKKGVIMMCVKPQETNNGELVSTPEYQEFILEGTEFQHYSDLWWKRLEEYYLKFI